jgi:hypothetical protein
MISHEFKYIARAGDSILCYRGNNLYEIKDLEHRTVMEIEFSPSEFTAESALNDAVNFLIDYEKARSGGDDFKFKQWITSVI